MRIVRLRAIAFLVLLAWCAAGCAGPSSTTGNARNPGNAGVNRDGVKTVPLAEMVRETVGSRVTAEVQPRGTIPYDNMTLPLISPDGRYIATRTGLAPTWQSLTAQPGAEVPLTSQVEIYELDPDSNALPRLHASVNEHVLLGRSVDEAGFLVEAPRENGARWIGRTSWTTGEVTWLVQDDESINAFATLGPNDSIAFSRRPLNELGFDLVVRRGETEWVLPAQSGENWLMPTYSGKGFGLFVLRLRDGALDAIRVNAETENGLRQPVLTTLAPQNATIRIAYNTLASNVVINAGKPPMKERLVLFHPTRLRIAVWDPAEGVAYPNVRSVSGVMDREDPNYALLTISGRPDRNFQPDEYLLRRNLLNALDESRLIAGPQIPRTIATGDHRYILFNPLDGSIGVTVMALVSPDEIDQ